ncbi:MAG: hypothetical protein U0835_10485 [Isosphaeraceae bacterium]
MKNAGRGALVVLAVVAAAEFFTPKPAQAQTQEKARRAVNFLATSKRGKDILSYLHFGGTYVDHEVLRIFKVTNRDGDEQFGHVAVKVSFDWTTSFGDNTTTAVFFFDEKGDPYEIQCEPGDTTSIISPPFGLANGAIQVLGNLLLAAAGDQMSAQEKSDMQKAIDKQDARQLLVDTLKVQKRLGL